MYKPILCLVAVLWMLAPAAWSQDRNDRDRSGSTPTLEVGGQGEAKAAPDVAVVRLGAEAQAKTAQAAQSQVSAVMERALQKIRAVGIAERDIQTTGVRLHPVYERQPRGDETPPEVVAYRASNTVQVEVQNLSLIGRVIDAGVGAGANRVEDISFDLRDDTAARTQALREAVAQARSKAEVLAKAMDVRLVAVHEVQEGGVHVIPPRPYGGARFARAEAVGTPIQPGELRVQASVVVRYRIAPR
jgi:uncharacterized protein YggE